MKQVVAFFGAILIVVGLTIAAPAAELQFTMLSRGYWQTVGDTLFSPEILPDMIYSSLGGDTLPVEYQPLVRQQIDVLAPRLDQVQKLTVQGLFDYVEGGTEDASTVLAELRSLNAEIQANFSSVPNFSLDALGQMESRLSDLEANGLPYLRTGYRQLRWTAIGGLALGGILFLFGLVTVLRFGGKGARGLRRVGSPLLVFGIPSTIAFGTAWLVLTPSTMRTMFEGTNLSSDSEFLAMGFGPETLNWLADNLQSLYWVSVAPLLIFGLAALGVGILLKLATPPPRSYYD